MPLISKHIFEKYSLAVWYISESPEELQNKLLIDDFIPFKNEKRNTHWLAARIALQETLPSYEFKIIKNIHGKPYLQDSEGHISITHSGNMAAAIFNKETLCGIDLEKFDNRISKIAYKFTNDRETQMLGSHYYNSFCCLIWSAKESVFKFTPLPDINFKEHILLEYLDIEKSILHFCFKKNENIYLNVNYKIFEVANDIVKETKLLTDIMMKKKEHYILTWI